MGPPGTTCGTQGDQADRANAAVNMTRTVSSSFSIQLRHKNRFRPPPAAALDPGFIQGLTTLLRKAAIEIEAAAGMALAGDDLETIQIRFFKQPHAAIHACIRLRRKARESQRQANVNEPEGTGFRQLDRLAVV